MTQLVLDANGNNIALPESRRGGYAVSREDLSRELVAISGRMFKDKRGKVWIVSYQFGYFNEETKNKIIESCEKGRAQPIVCGFLTQNSTGALTYRDFFVTSLTRPKFMWSRLEAGEAAFAPVPMWGDFSVTLREVYPSD